jgi:Ca-activated chloride channel homolog
MTFLNLWALLLLPAILAWVVLRWPRTEARTGLVLKALALAAVVLALAEPVIPVWETKVAVTILADTSASLSDADLARASEHIARIEAHRGRHWSRIIPFARETRDPAPEELTPRLQLRRTSGEAGRATDIESALRAAVGATPARMVPRIVLISDGRENSGHTIRAAWQARQLGTPIDTYVLPGRPRPELRLESVSMPAVVFSGERFSIELNVASPRATPASVAIAAEGRELGETGVELQPGMNTLRVTASVAAAGALELVGAVRAGDLGEVRFAQALTLRRPRLLFVSSDSESAEADLLETLAAAQFEVKRVDEIPAASLDDYQVVAFNNWDLEAIAPARKADIEDFVQQGGGLLVIGGERNVYVEQKGVEDALDRVLPATLAPPRSPEGTCVVLIIDKSSSMEGRKMELARLAAIGVVDNLRPIDMIGVLIFDNSNQWAVPIRRAEDRPLIKRLIAGITPDGGTQIAPALAEAYRRILPQPATFKHIVLLTDGISEEGDSLSLSKEAAAQRVTISTVGLGQDVNKAYLERVASLAKGKPYFVTDPSMLEQILLRDVMEHTGSTAVEKPLRPIVTRQAEILAGVGMESAPPLKGYVRFIAKPTAETILRMDQKDPLLARWQYGLGRAAVFTSDAKARWAADWVNWPGYDRFWANLLRDLLPHSQPGEANLQFDSGTGRLEVTYRLSRAVPEPARPPDIFVIGPDGFRQTVSVRRVAAGVFSGSVAIGERKGLFRIRPLEDSRAFPEVGYYRQEEEMMDYGSNPALLRQIASYTGGRFEPPPAQVFATDGRAVASEMSLWPGLLAVALLLNLAELVYRKRKGLRELFARRAPAEAGVA